MMSQAVVDVEGVPVSKRSIPTPLSKLALTVARDGSSEKENAVTRATATATTSTDKDVEREKFKVQFPSVRKHSWEKYLKPFNSHSGSGKLKRKAAEGELVVKVDGKRFTTKSAFDTFWEYAAERHAVEERRRAGERRPWSKKSIFEEYKFCSVFRISDRGSQFLIKEVIQKGSQEAQELLFRVLLYSSFVRVETYQLLQQSLGPLTWKTYDHAKYSNVLLQAINNGDSIYTGAFQKFPPQLGYSNHAHDNHLALLEIMMSSDLLRKLKRCEYMADTFDVIYQFPGSGDFVAFQLLINLSYTPLVDFSEDDFVIAGVGAVKGLNKCFSPPDLVGGSEGELIRWMTKTQEEQFRRLGLEPVTLTDGKGKRRMSLVDVEHTLCELHKYLRIISSGNEGTGYGRRFSLKTPRLPQHPTFPTVWSSPSRQLPKPKPGRSGCERAEKVYVITAILDKGETGDGEVLYYVDWLGYPESARTWEPKERLVADVPGVVEEFERTLKLGEGASGSRKRKRCRSDSVDS